MRAGFSQVFPCFNPAGGGPNRSESDVIFGGGGNTPLDETLGHSFCYVRSSAQFISPTHSDRFVSPSQSFRFDDPRPSKPSDYPETGFRAISGASVSANTSTPITVLQLDDICTDAADTANHHYYQNNCSSSSDNKGFVAGAGPPNVLLDGFESTPSFSALPLQRVPRGSGEQQPSGPLERAFFMSGPIKRGALSGPLDGTASGDSNGGMPFSAPLRGIYVKKRKKMSISGIRNTLVEGGSEKMLHK